MLCHFNRVVKWMALCSLAVFVSMLFDYNAAMAKYGLSVAPMDQKMVLDLGESREASFTMSNPSSSTEDVYYKITVEPFYVDESGNTIFEAEGDSGEMVNWIAFNIPTEGKMEPNEIKEVSFTINVPKVAPAGGQYVAIFVTTDNKPVEDHSSDQSGVDNGTSNAGINEIRRLGHLIYAEVVGTTIRKGEVLETNVPSFLLSGQVFGSSTVKNNGNVHGEAKYTLRVFPLFSNEEIYSNEEKPETRTLLPNRSMYAETKWDKTPAIGIFNVVYTVEFEGSTAEVRKMVIKCPVWLLFLILFVIAAIIIYFVTRVKARRNSRRDEE